MAKIEINVTGEISSVEKGSIYSQPSNPVIAFSVGQVKAIVKGDQAKVLWNCFLKDCGTVATTKSVDGYSIEKKVQVSFKGELKDYRKEGVVVENITDVKFDYSYKVN